MQIFLSFVRDTRTTIGQTINQSINQSIDQVGAAAAEMKFGQTQTSRKTLLKCN